MRIKLVKNMPTVDEISKITSEFVEDNFPKGECKERGKAIVLHAQMLIAIHALFTKRIKNDSQDK